MAAISALKVEVTLFKMFLQLPPCLCGLNVLTVMSSCNGVI